MFAFLTKLPSLWKYLGIVLLALALVSSIVLGVNSCKKIDQAQDNALVESGVIKERDRGNQEVINNVKEARDAVDNPTDNELNVVCGKYDRNCQNSK